MDVAIKALLTRLSVEVGMVYLEANNKAVAELKKGSCGGKCVTILTSYASPGIHRSLIPQQGPHLSTTLYLRINLLLVDSLAVWLFAG